MANLEILNKIGKRPELTGGDLKYVREHIYNKLFNEYFPKPWTYYNFEYPKKSPFDGTIEGIAIHNPAKVNPNLPAIPWGGTWNGIRRGLRYLRDPMSIITEYSTWAGIGDISDLVRMPTNLVIPFLSALKTNITKDVDVLDSTWVRWIDLVTLAGYPKFENRENVDDPHKWLEKFVKDEHSAEFWAESFHSTFLKFSKKVPKNIMSLDEFALSRWMWVTPGASSYSKLYLGKTKIKTKFGAAVSLSDEELLDIVHSKQDIKIFIKPDEVGYKKRLIANVSLGGYIIAAYVRYVLTQFMGEPPGFFVANISVEETFDVVSLLRARQIAIPIDESSFDYNVSRNAWLGFIQFLKKFGIPDLNLFGKMLGIPWTFGDEKGTWLKGMPSGLALTTMLDSWMNYIKQRTIIPGKLNWAAGDDSLVFKSEKVDLQDLAQDYLTFGAVVNPYKNWQSGRYAEYLKVVYLNEGTTGYPARIFSSIIWSQRIDTTFLPLDKLYAMTALFKSFFDRLNKPFSNAENLRYVAADLSRMVSQKLSGFNISIALKWLKAARAQGGYGLWPYNDYEFSWNQGVVEKEKYINTIVRVPDNSRFKQGTQSFSYKRIVVKQATYKLGPPLILPAVNNMEEWEKRLNREDYPIRGKFADMALDIIPLPVFDFISEKNISSVAKQSGYNSFPNIRGTVSQIPFKLRAASEALLMSIINWMSSHQLTTLVT